MGLAGDLDRALLGGKLRHLYRSIRFVATSARETRALSRLGNRNMQRMLLSYTKNAQSELARLCDLYGSDKGGADSDKNPYTWPSHNYTDFYELIFGQKRESIKQVLECGLGTNDPGQRSSMGASGKPGASLRVWRDYFPKANVTGIDIDRDILFSEERITTYEVDQTSPDSIHAFLQSLPDDCFFDVVIDDGLHEYHAGRTLFQGLIDRLADDGVYIIEDVDIRDLAPYARYFEECEEKYYVRFINLQKYKEKLNDSSLIMISKK